MKKKLFAIALSAMLLVSASACGNPSQNTADDTHAEHDHVHVPSTGEVIENDQFTVELTLPAEYIGDATQEQLTQTAAALGYKSITLNDDGSATYIMTEEQHQKMLEDIAKDLKRSVSEMVSPETYPSFSNVTVNEDFTKYMITTISTEYGEEEERAVMSLLMTSGIYYMFKGEPAGNVHIDVVNLDSDDVLYSYDSQNGQTE